MDKEFKPTTWCLHNRTTIFVFTIFLLLVGYKSYESIPKENFPNVTIPTIFVNTVYPGTSPVNMETFITKPLEKKFKNIKGLKNLNSVSRQDISSISVEFESDVEIDKARQRVQDEVNKARQDLPQDLPQDPILSEINFADTPILFIDLYSSESSLFQINKYAKALKNRLELLPEISKVNDTNTPEPEIRIEVDLYKMEVAQIALSDIVFAISRENISSSAGNITIGKLKRTISIQKQFRTVDDFNYLVIQNPQSKPFYLKDLATVKDDYIDSESFNRTFGKNSIQLQVVKSANTNLIKAADKVKQILEEFKQDVFPKHVQSLISNDQSDVTKASLRGLLDTIIIGFILVTIILMFFMGTTNALFVSLSVPLSCAVAFITLSIFGITLNMIVLFAFLLALGIIVDDAIVVIENTYRIYHSEKGIGIIKAAKKATGEVFSPVLSGTLTTVAPFLPLAFWPGLIGEFMVYLPVTLLIVLMASLFVAYIINPVFAVRFMKRDSDPQVMKDRSLKFRKKVAFTFLGIAIIGYLIDMALGNLVVVIYAIYLFIRFFLNGVIHKFQTQLWPKIENSYKTFLKWSIRRPIRTVIFTVCIFILSFVIVGLYLPKVIFFPQGPPNLIQVGIELPIASDEHQTNKAVLAVEQRITKVLEKDKKIVQSISSRVAKNIGGSSGSHLGQVVVYFKKFEERDGVDTYPYLDKIREALEPLKEKYDMAVNVAKDDNGPPVGDPISIEITGDDVNQLYHTSLDIQRLIKNSGIEGIENLNSNFNANKPEILFDIDREKANQMGINVSKISNELRTALYGTEASTYKFGIHSEDKYPINVRLKDGYQNINTLENLKITFRDNNDGGRIKQIPISSFIKISYMKSYLGLNRKNSKNIIILSSNVLSGYNIIQVVGEIENLINTYTPASNINIKMGGQQEEQDETEAFLLNALLISIGLILLILLILFNSISKSIIILSQVLFSITGVILGFGVFGMDLSIIMTGVGIVSLTGIVVKNGILIIEFIDLNLQRGVALNQAIVFGSIARMKPVILTATATILGLLPLAVGFNIDFHSLLSSGDPKISFGGDNVVFWGPLSWTIIFGLTYATFITLIFVPSLYLISLRIKKMLNIKPKIE